MKKIIVSVVFIALVGILSYSCGKAVDEKKKSVNPNGDSELAIVMRTMMQSGKTMKNEIENHLAISPYPVEIKTITTAKPTDGMIADRDIFNALANYHMATLDSVYIPNTDPVVQFNHVVKSCVDCHSNYCQGPIPAIKQLYISSK